MPTLSPLHLAILRAIAALAPAAYGVPLRAAVGAALGRSVSYGALYAALGQLEEARLVYGRDEAGGPERGGRARRRWLLTAQGRHEID